MRHLVKWFLEGLAILAPLFITAWITVKIFQLVDGILPLDIPGLGFVVTIALIVLVGLLAHTMLGGLFRQLEDTVSRLPLVKILYNAVKDLFGAFAGEKKKFDKPVTVQLAPGSKAKLVGFVTQKDLKHLGLKGEVAVYCPHSYNFSGQLIVVPSKYVKPLKADSSEVMSFVVSGGVAGG